MGINSCILKFEGIVDDADHGLQYLGPTIRGFFGYALKSVVCMVSHRNCSQCLLSSACPYTKVFEGRPPSNRTIMTRYPAIPQPFILIVPSPEKSTQMGRTISWSIRLLGETSEMAPYIIESFVRAAHQGLGRKRVGFHLIRVIDGQTGDIVWDQDAELYKPPVMSEINRKDMPASPCTLRWQFHTPVHIREQGGLNVTPSGLDLVLAGRRRHVILNQFYSEVAQEEVTQPPHIESDAFETIESHLYPWHIQRYSGRQRRKIPLAGSLGSVTIHGPWDKAGDWLATVEQLHLGKYTSFGFGSVTWEVI